MWYFKMKTDQQKLQGINSWKAKGFFFLMSKGKICFHPALNRVYNK